MDPQCIPDGKRLYVTHQDKSALYVFEIDTATGSFTDQNTVDLIQWSIPSMPVNLEPHEVGFSPRGDKYIATCQRTNEIRIYQVSNDSLIAVLDVGDFPQEYAYSEDGKYCFVTCMEDLTTTGGDPFKRGSVAIVDMDNNSLVKSVHTGFQPHGIAVDDRRNVVIVANRNSNPDGPAPHHTTDCGGRNGYISVIDMNTLELVDGYKPGIVS